MLTGETIDFNSINNDNVKMALDGSTLRNSKLGSTKEKSKSLESTDTTRNDTERVYVPFQTRQSDNSLEVEESSKSNSVNSYYGLRIRLVDFDSEDSKIGKFTCALCQLIICDPVQLEECGHRFCRRCWEKYVDTRDVSDCPVDKGIIVPGRVFDDKAFQLEMETLIISCSQNTNLSQIKNGCSWQGVLRDFLDHYNGCEWRPIPCPLNCGHFLESRNLETHIQQGCRLSWQRCNFCSVPVIANDMQQHIESLCLEVSIPCPNKCNTVSQLARRLIFEHMREKCPLEIKNCPFQIFGCKITGNMDYLKEHAKRKALPHLNMLADHLKMNSAILEQSVQTLLTEKKKSSTFEKRISNLDNIWGCQLIWKIEKYAMKFNDAKSGNITTYFSPTFLSSRYGYRLALAICPYGDGNAKGQFLSLYVCLYKGDYDNLLEWPFPLKITFSLLDQAPNLVDRKNITYTFVPNLVKENLPFLGRPQKERNPFFGARKFISLSDLMKHTTYIVNQNIFFKVAVQEKYVN